MKDAILEKDISALMLEFRKADSDCMVVVF